MKWFSDVTSLNELKKQYKALTKKHHPDRGGSTERMAEINAEYDEIYQVLQQQNNTNSEGPQTDDIFQDDGYREVLNVLLDIPDIEVELVGSWLWIDGSTYKHKETLKEAGCRWASKKKKWYWRPEGYQKKGGKTWSMKKIRNTYGSEKLKEAEEREALAG